MTRGDPKDVRSTGRRRARAALYKEGRTFECGDCGAIPRVLPKDWPRNPPEIGRGNGNLVPKLEANHMNKQLLDNDPANLEWLCSSCHIRKDRKTEIGETTVENQFHTRDLF